MSQIALFFCFLLMFLTSAAHAGGRQSGKAPPRTQGEYVGAETCTACHEAVSGQFSRSVHARLAEFETRGHVVGCEACHGAGKQHIESADPGKIFSFKRGTDPEINENCLSCHLENVGHDWGGSEHALGGLACTECHRIHQSRRAFAVTEKSYATMQPRLANAPPPRYSLAKSEPQLCLDCHRDKTGQMMLTSHHPIREGKMRCSSCHQVHGSPVRQLRTEERASDLCLQCHTSKQGPFVYEHAPVSESCLTCHDPHGTVANNLLRQNEPFLCLQCHEAHFHIGRSGITTPLSLPSGSATNRYGEQGWRVAFGTKCTQCHTMIHGSDLPGHSTPSGGKALTR